MYRVTYPCQGCSEPIELEPDNEGRRVRDRHVPARGVGARRVRQHAPRREPEACHGSTDRADDSQVAGSRVSGTDARQERKVHWLCGVGAGEGLILTSDNGRVSDVSSLHSPPAFETG